MENTLIKLTLHDETKKRAHDSQIVRAKENLKLSHGGSSYSRWVQLQLYHVCPTVRKIIHSLKLVDYLNVQADKPWYNYYIITGVFMQLFSLFLDRNELARE